MLWVTCEDLVCQLVTTSRCDVMRFELPVLTVMLCKLRLGRLLATG